MYYSIERSEDNWNQRYNFTFSETLAQACKS